MTDQWVPGPGCTPVPPDGIPPANTWTPADSCAPPSGPSITGGVIITGVPATIVAPYAWGITLNDGSAPPNFSIDHFDSTGVPIESPIAIDGASGDVMVTHDPTQPLGVATKEYVDSHSAGVTEAPTDGQLYARQNEGWTVIPPDSVQEAPTDGQAYVRQSLAWAPLAASLSGYMPISGGTFAGPVAFSAANGVLVQGAAGSPRAILGVTGNAARWQMLLGDTTAESGSNAGSNFALNAISDTGMLLSTPLAIARSTGAITVGVTPGIAPLTINGAQGSWRSVAGQTNGSQRWQMYLGDFGAELGSNAGSNFRLSSYTDAGGALASPLVIARQTGVATFSALPSLPGGAAGNVLSTNGAGALSWIAPSGGGISDAPNDGTAYARKSAGWSNLAHTDITDWTATLAPYALTTAVPVAATTLPLANGVAAAGTSTAYARADHVHPITSMGDNRIINGNFAINQRGSVSGTALAAAAYGHDRWKAGAAGCTYTFTAALPDTTVTITAGTLTQIIEAGMIEGGVYTLSWTGTAQARVYQGAPTGAYAASPITTASLSAGTNTIVEFNAGTVGTVKLEIGSIATPFNRQSMARLLADCQRYCILLTQLMSYGYNAANSGGWSSNYVLPTTMRATPTVSFSSITSSANAVGIALTAVTSTSFTTSYSITATGAAWAQFTAFCSAEL